WYCRFVLQAEDGIRYRNVTGVQTCALPISSSHCSMAFVRNWLLWATQKHSTANYHSIQCSKGKIIGRLHIIRCCVHRSLWRSVRSEERRVGKECTARTAADRDGKEAWKHRQ